MPLSRAGVNMVGGGGGGGGNSELTNAGFAIAAFTSAAAASGGSVGPATYSPRREAIHSSSHGPKFSSAPRFQSSALSYISPRHNSDLLCTASQGPKYALPPAEVTMTRAPAVGWGRPEEVRARAERAAILAASGGGGSDAGPAAYTPRVEAVKPSAPSIGFGRSERFASGAFGSYRPPSYASADAPMLLPNTDAVLPASPRYSFATPRDPHSGRQHTAMRPRTSFMTHSIRGGLAKPATLECNVGPTDYDVRVGDISYRAAKAAQSAPASARSGFGSSPRFMRPGVEFLSAAHASSHVGQSSPGPKYSAATGTLAATASKGHVQRASALKWLP